MTIIHNVHHSNFANMMIKYLAAIKCAQRLDHCCLSNYSMPDWHIDLPPISAPAAFPVDLTSDMYINADRLRYLSHCGVDRFNFHGHLQRMENLPGRRFAANLFSVRPSEIPQVATDELLCPIRGAEILDAIHSGYPLLPVAFYKEVIKKSGLRPVFMGQTDQNIYTSHLFSEFPKARVLPHASPQIDFELIRRARNIVLPVSTFAWLAAWLSDDAESITMPVVGLYNPTQFPDHDLIPADKPGWIFYQFPIMQATPLHGVLIDHKKYENSWKLSDAQHFVRA